MKLKKFFPLFALVLGTCFIFTACGDDEPTPSPQDEGQPSELNKEVVGTYSGWTELKTTYLNRRYDGDTFILKQEEDGTLTAIFNNATWGTATIKGLNVYDEEESSGAYLVHNDTRVGEDTTNPTYDYYLTTGAKGSFVMNNPRTGQTEEYPCEVGLIAVGTGRAKLLAWIKAYMEGGHGDMDFTFQTGEMPTE